DGALGGTAGAGGDGRFAVPVPPLQAGQVLTAIQEVSGINSPPSAPITVRARPPAPSLTSPLIEGSTQIAGTGIAGAHVEGFVNGAFVSSGAVAADGVFALPVAPLVAGQQVSATQTVAGVISIPSAVVTV